MLPLFLMDKYRVSINTKEYKWRVLEKIERGEATPVKAYVMQGETSIGIRWGVVSVDQVGYGQVAIKGRSGARHYTVRGILTLRRCAANVNRVTRKVVLETLRR